MKKTLVVLTILSSASAYAGLTQDQAFKLAGHYTLVKEQVSGYPSYSCRALRLEVLRTGEVNLSFDGNYTDSTKREISIPQVIYSSKNLVTVSHFQGTDGEEIFVNGDRLVDKEITSIQAKKDLVKLNYKTVSKASDPWLLLFLQNPTYANDKEWHSYEADLTGGTITYRLDRARDGQKRRREIECSFKKVEAQS